MGAHVHRPSRLIGSAVTDSPTASDWRHRSICRDKDPELWFSVGTGPEAQTQDDEAKAICHACPVEEECLNFALDKGLDHGVWGGMTEGERRVLRRRGATHTAGQPGQRRCEDCRNWFTPSGDARTGRRQKRCASCAANKARQWKHAYEEAHR